MHRRAQPDEIKNAFAKRLICSFVVVLAAQLGGCDGSEDGHSKTLSGSGAADDLIWSYMINEISSIDRIRKWDQANLKGLMIVDESRVQFYDQFTPLMRQVGEDIGIKIDACEAVVSAGGIQPPRESSGCDGTPFDFYFVVADGTWTETEWHGAQETLDARAVELLDGIRERIATVPGEEHTCRIAFGYDPDAANRIEHAVVVMDSEQPLMLGKCGTYLFLNMLGLFPFEGPQPLDPAKEAKSLAELLLKQTPNGGTYLLKLLYSPNVKPGMSKIEFLQAVSG